MIKNFFKSGAVLVKSPSLHLYVLAITIVSYMMIYVGNEVCDLLLAKKSHVISAVLLVSPFFIFKPKVQKYVWSVIFLIGIWALMQLMYSRTYHDIMPLSSFLMTENISWLLIDSAIGSLRFFDLYLLVPLFLSYIFYILLIRKRLDENGGISLWKQSLTLMVVSIVMFLFSIYKEYIYYINEENLEHDIDLYTEIMVVRLSENTNNRAYSLNGFIPYFVYQTYVNVKIGKINLDENQLKQIKEIIDRKLYQETIKQESKKNLILIIVESLNSWCVDMTIEGKSVTQVLSEILKKNGTIKALKVLPQVCHGCSSDGHFIYNTGILPIKDGVVSMNYGESDYPSLAKVLDYDSSVNIICDDVYCWNQECTSVSYGYNKLYGIEEIKDSLNVEEGITDELMFNFASKTLPKLKQPFFAQLVTLNMHQPYYRLKVPPTWISESDEYSENVRNYLEAVHFFDVQLGKFIDSLKKNGLYDNSVIVIASDHNNLDANALDGREKAEYNDMYIPMFVLNADTTLHYENVMGQVDVYPTILDIMGVEDYSWRGVGNSILKEPKVCSAVTKFGDVVGDANSELVQEQHEAWEVSELLIRSRYFDKNKVNSLYDK